jgi:hypothetical protein
VQGPGWSPTVNTKPSDNALAAFELADRIESGMVHINDQTIADEQTSPFGGTKGSGFGGHFGGGHAVSTRSVKSKGHDAIEYRTLPTLSIQEGLRGRAVVEQCRQDEPTERISHAK